MTTYLRKKLLAFMVWLEGVMQNDQEFDRNDPEWNELQNEATSIKNQLRRQIDAKDANP